MSNAFDQFDEEQPNAFDQFDVAEAAAPEEPKEPSVTDTFFSNLSRFMGNAFEDGKEVVGGMFAPLANPDLMTKAMSDLMYNEEGEYSTDGIKAVGSAMADRAGEIISDPVGSFVERPLSTMMDVATVAMPTRAASFATRPVNSTLSRTLNNAAEVIDNFDPLTAATTGAAGVAARTGGQERMEEILKPSLSETDIRMQPAHRERVITSALDKGIMPTPEGMGKLHAKIRIAAEKSDELIMASDAIVTVDELVAGIRQQAELIPDSNKDALRLRKAIEAEADSLAKRYEGREVLGVEELRDLRRSGDDAINHNRTFVGATPVKVQADKAYANTLREILAGKVDGLGDLNAEMSDLYDIADMYIKPTQRLKQNNSLSLAQQILAGNSGAQVGGSTLTAAMLGFDPALGAAIGGASHLLASRANNPAIKMKKAQRVHDMNKRDGSLLGNVLLRDADKYKPTRDGRYGLLLIDELMQEEEERQRRERD